MNLFKNVLLISSFAGLTLQAGQDVAFLSTQVISLQQSVNALQGAVQQLSKPCIEKLSEWCAENQNALLGAASVCLIGTASVCLGVVIGSGEGNDREWRNGVKCGKLECQDLLFRAMCVNEQIFKRLERLKLSVDDENMRNNHWYYSITFNQKDEVLLSLSAKAALDVDTNFEQLINACVQNDTSIKFFKVNLYNSIMDFFKTLKSELKDKGISEGVIEKMLKIDANAMAFLLN